MEQSNSLKDKIMQRLSELYESGQLSNNDMVRIIEHVGSYLNLCTRSQWAKDHGKVYNTAKKCRQNIVLFGVTLIIDNE